MLQICCSQQSHFVGFVAFTPRISNLEHPIWIIPSWQQGGMSRVTTLGLEEKGRKKGTKTSTHIQCRTASYRVFFGLVGILGWLGVFMFLGGFQVRFSLHILMRFSPNTKSLLRDNYLLQSACKIFQLRPFRISTSVSGRWLLVRTLGMTSYIFIFILSLLINLALNSR